MALDDLSLEAVQYACKQVLRSETFMPVPAIIRAYAKEWEAKQRQALERTTRSAEECVQLREQLVDLAQVRALIQSVFPSYPNNVSVLDPQIRAEHLQTVKRMAEQEHATRDLASGDDDSWPVERKG